MANQLKMAIREAKITIKKRGRSNRRIAQELGFERGTVARYLRSTVQGTRSESTLQEEITIEAL